MTGFTHTNSPQDALPAPGLHTNDNLVSQQVSGFVAADLAGGRSHSASVTPVRIGDDRTWRILRLQPKSAFSRLALVYSTDLKGQQRVEGSRSLSG
jgi:hypothetical protein